MPVTNPAFGLWPEEETEEHLHPEKKQWHPDDLGYAVAAMADAEAEGDGERAAEIADKFLHGLIDEWAERRREEEARPAPPPGRLAEVAWRAAAGPPELSDLLRPKAAEALLRAAGIGFFRVRQRYLVSATEAADRDGRTPGPCAVVVADVPALNGSPRTVHLFWRPGPDGQWRLVKAAAEIPV